MKVIENIGHVLREWPSQYGTTLEELSAPSPLLLVFLRHLGCSFCRQTLEDLTRARGELSGRGVDVALVHMATEREAAELFARYGLEDVPRFSDPERHFYRAFGLRNGGYKSLWNPRVLAQGWQAAKTHGVGRPRGSLFQMPGVFLLDQGRVLAGNQLFTAADRPNYIDVVSTYLALAPRTGRGERGATLAA